MSYPNIGIENKNVSYEPVIQPNPLFNALNGEELLDVICTHLKRELGQHDEFRQHLTYPKFMYSVKLEIDVFTATVPIEKEVKSEPVKASEGETKQTISKVVGTKKPVDTPDKTREEAGMPTSGRLVNEAGVFDVPKPNRLTLG